MTSASREFIDSAVFFDFFGGMVDVVDGQFVILKSCERAKCDCFLRYSRDQVLNPAFAKFWILLLAMPAAALRPRQ